MTAERTFENSVRDNQERRRFELDVGGQVAFASYAALRATLIIPHVEPRHLCAAPALRSRSCEGSWRLPEPRS